MKKKRGKIAIPAPIANFGERVMVFNYRSLKQEEGTVVSLQYENKFGAGWSWTYSVKTIRIAKSGYGVKLYVGDDGITRI